MEERQSALSVYLSRKKKEECGGGGCSTNINTSAVVHLMGLKEQILSDKSKKAKKHTNTNTSANNNNSKPLLFSCNFCKC